MKLPFGEKKHRGYSVSAKAAKEGEVWIYEVIGEFFGGISADQFRKDLQTLGDVSKITLHINSPGGEVFDGIAIYNILKQHKARIIVNVDGWAASIASVIAMAGDEIIMAENAQMMIHNAWGGGFGDAKRMRQIADELDHANGSVVRSYLARAKVSESELLSLMEVETWMYPEDAIKLGLADSVSEPIQMAACFDLSKFRYKNAPLSAKGDAAGPLECSADDNEQRTRLQRSALALEQGRNRAAGTPGDRKITLADKTKGINK